MLLLTLFVVPGVVMIVAYGLISRELYRGIQFELGQKTSSPGESFITVIYLFTHVLTSFSSWVSEKTLECGIGMNNKC